MSGSAIGGTRAGGIFAALILAAVLAGCHHGQAPVPRANISVVGHVYVTNNGDGTVSAFSRMSNGNLIFQKVVRAGAVNGPTGIAISPSNRFVYVANEGDNRVYQFSIRRHDGLLTPIGTGWVDAGSRPQHIAITRDGHFAYVTNAGGDKGVAGSVSEYSINQKTGLLTPLGTFQSDALKRPFGIVTGYDDRFIYASDPAAGTILSFTVGPDGRLQLAESTPSLGTKKGQPQLMAVGPAGKFLYAVDGHEGKVAAFKIGADGKLDFEHAYSMGEETGEPIGIVLTTAGKDEFAYTTNRAISTVSYFVVSNGKLTLLAQTASGLGGPTGIVADPDGRFLYVVDRDAATIAQFDILPAHHGTAVLHATTFNEDPANQSSHPLYIAMTN